MPLAPGTPYRNSHVLCNSEEWEFSPTSSKSTHTPSSELPTILTAGATQAHAEEKEQEEIEMGNLYVRRKSRMTSIDLHPAEQHRPSWFDVSADLPLRVYDAEQHGGRVDVKRPDEAHLHPATTWGNEAYQSQVNVVEDRPERDLEGGVWLTRREKKEWAILILVGSLSVCGLCGLIAGLAVT